jgi:2-polyprenyl-3-methyl-5-hydroxy-6-metoxy-1,4-benzoquinol methylase
MFSKSIKTAVRRLGSRLGLMTDWSAPVINGQQAAGWYDKAYERTAVYHCPYPQSWYYFLWTVIADRIRRAGIRSVLEIGCGPGQLAALLFDQGITNYVGLDFSEKAIGMARRNCPQGRFVIADARSSDVYELVEHEALICTEVLEHVQDDLAIVSRFLPGTRCVCSVPNFPAESHVRHFRDAAEVAQRYQRFFGDFDVATLKGPRRPTQEFFLFDGIRRNS